jgi:predicted nuclease of restriction endonuclease-like (RecB) superfamily
MENTILYAKIADFIDLARRQVITAVNTTMVYTYFEIGRMIVENEQQGQHRATYGKQVLKELSQKLTKQFGKGFSVENLDRMRFFYKTYSPHISSTLLTKFTLSWSHYLILMRIENEAERNFYEIEATNNHWSLRELERQHASALYERLALSRDKEGVKQLPVIAHLLASDENQTA